MSSLPWRAAAPLALALALAACVAPKPKTPGLVSGAVPAPPTLSSCLQQTDDSQEPPFIRQCYEPFSRNAAVAIATREWKAWGEVVYDADPKDEQQVDPNTKAERQDGYWQRVGEYWWLGMNQSSDTAGYTGKHDASGTEFSPDDDGTFAWSAAFISYVMRMAGGGTSFPYAQSHSDYINAAAEETNGTLQQYAIMAEPPGNYPPALGDLICFGRGRAAALHYENLPTGHFAGHCGIVVAGQPGQISIIGGNVEDAVALTHVPVTPQGMIADPDGSSIDPRYPWLTVIRVLYAR
jgi:hypothetical protein